MEPRERPGATVGVTDEATEEVELAHDEQQVESLEESEGPDDEREEREHLREYLTKEYGELGEESGGPKATDPRGSAPAGEQAPMQESKEQPVMRKFQEEVTQADEAGRRPGSDPSEMMEHVHLPDEEQQLPLTDDGQKSEQDNSLKEKRRQPDSSQPEEAHSTQPNTRRFDSPEESAEGDAEKPNERERTEKVREARPEGPAGRVVVDSGPIQPDSREQAFQERGNVEQENGARYAASANGIRREAEYPDPVFGPRIDSKPSKFEEIKMEQHRDSSNSAPNDDGNEANNGMGVRRNEKGEDLRAEDSRTQPDHDFTRSGRTGLEPDQVSKGSGEAANRDDLIDSRPRMTETRAETDKAGNVASSPGKHEGEGNRPGEVPAKRLLEEEKEKGRVLFVVQESKGGPSHFLRLQREHLDGFGKDEIIEVRVARESAPEREFNLYTSSGYADPHLNISHLNPTPRESFRVLSLRRFEMLDFVQDFNKHKPEPFANVTLSYSDGAVTMKVDNLVASINNPRLSTRGQGPILEGSMIQGRSLGNIRIAKESDTFALHFRDYSSNHPKIVHMKAMDSYMEVGIKQSSHEPDYRTRRIPAVSAEPARDKVENEVKNRFTEIDSSNMTKKEIRAWIDTEGSIYSQDMGGRSGPEIRVVQKHREPLDVYARSVESMGIGCRVYRDKRGLHVARIGGTENVAKVIAEVGPFRTPQKREQVRQFIEKLKAPRKERRRVIERAKKILNL